MGISSSQAFRNAFDLQFFTADRAIGSTGLTNIVNSSEVGYLATIGIWFTVSPTGTPTLTLELQIDGGTTRSLTLLSAAATWSNDVIPWIASHQSAASNSNINSLHLNLNVQYNSSIRVGLNCTGAGSAGTAHGVVIKGPRL